MATQIECQFFRGEKKSYFVGVSGSQGKAGIRNLGGFGGGEHGFGVWENWYYLAGRCRHLEVWLAEQNNESDTSNKETQTANCSGGRVAEWVRRQNPVPRQIGKSERNATEGRASKAVGSQWTNGKHPFHEINERFKFIAWHGRKGFLKLFGWHEGETRQTSEISKISEVFKGKSLR